jgi:hypothetical protein
MAKNQKNLRGPSPLRNLYVKKSLHRVYYAPPRPREDERSEESRGLRRAAHNRSYLGTRPARSMVQAPCPSIRPNSRLSLHPASWPFTSSGGDSVRSMFPWLLWLRPRRASWPFTSSGGGSVRSVFPWLLWLRPRRAACCMAVYSPPPQQLPNQLP